jgi:HEAT repeat protein
MKAATVHDIKQELIHLQPAKLTEICLRLAKFKKENKELISYLLFEAGDENGYIQSVKNEMDEMFDEINQSTLYYTKKTLRKILRVTNKHIRYISGKTAEVELLIYFLRKIKQKKIPLQKSVLLANVYNGQQKKVQKLIQGLHEDLQHDYLQQMEQLV